MITGGWFGRAPWFVAKIHNWHNLNGSLVIYEKTVSDLCLSLRKFYPLNYGNTQWTEKQVFLSGIP